jgi:adenylate cyclase
MALFGLDRQKEAGAKAALRCALSMFERLDSLNERLVGELETPLEIGIGIHSGQPIVGRMGPPKTPIISAVGDSVNTAARLERMTRELGAPLVVSAETLGAAGLDTSVGLTQVSLRGRVATMPVSALDKAGLRGMLI